MLTKKWKVKAYLPGGLGMCPYDGWIYAYGIDRAAAISDAKMRIWREHGHRAVKIESVEEV